MTTAERPSYLPYILIAAAIAIHLFFEASGEVIEPNGGKRFVGFLIISGWLSLFALLSTKLPAKRRSLLILGATPHFMLALLSVVYSFPIYVLPALILVIALANVRDTPSTMSI